MDTKRRMSNDIYNSGESSFGGFPKLNAFTHDLYINDFLQRDLVDAEARIQFLEQFILDSGLEIPYPVVDNTVNNDEDWLPF